MNNNVLYVLDGYTVSDYVEEIEVKESSWLVRRLSPYKKDNARWVALATALQSFWEDNFDPEYSRLLDMRSIYTASEEDLAARIRDLGDYFTPDYPTEYDQPLTVAWRESELQRKGTEFILTSTFRRNFSGLSVEWLPLWAPKDTAYGTSFISRLSPTLNAETHFLTSRGKVFVDLVGFWQNGAWEKSEFSDMAKALVRKIKPLHIVFDGVLFCLLVDIDLEAGFMLHGVAKKNVWISFYGTTVDCFDVVMGDDRSLDVGNTVTVVSQKNKSLPIGFMGGAILRFDDVPADVFVLDQ